MCGFSITSKSAYLFLPLLLMATGAFALLDNAAGPRQGTVYVIDVALPDAASYDFLVTHNFDVDRVRAGVATVYAIEAELRELDANGFSYRITNVQPLPQKAYSGYHTYATLTTDLKALRDAHTAICRLVSLGQSSEGRELWACLITHDPDAQAAKPAVKYVSTIHGDEPVGMELCVNLISLLLDSDGADARITALLEQEAVWIVPLMNPDGLESGKRYNAQGYDLNRSFPAYPDKFVGTVFSEPMVVAGRQPEVAHVMNWSAEKRFVVSANLHTGSLVVNYPYDNDGKPSGAYAASPDDALFQAISRSYSEHNLPMWNSPDFTDGITNGCAWYSVTGGMQDWNYRYMACNEVTIELSNIKAPASSQLAGLWDDNRESMLSYLETAQMGVAGVMRDGAGQPIQAQVSVQNNAQPVFSHPLTGYYHRMLLPGTYTMRFSAPGFVQRLMPSTTVVEDAPAALDVVLKSADINGDGKATAADLQLTINTVLGLRIGTDCDFDADSNVSSTDIQVMVNYLLAL